MASRRFTTGTCIVMLAALFAACDDDDGPGSDPTTGGRTATGGAPDTGGRAANGGTAGRNEAGSGGDTILTLKPCLDRPGELQRPPSGGLPCDLLPPDFGR
jgi:hypothetical protein